MSKFFQRERPFLIFLIFTLFLSGCVTTQAKQLKGLKQKSRILSTQVAAIELKEAYSQDHGLYLHYDTILKDTNSRHAIYGQVSWEKEEDQSGLSKNIYVPIQFVTDKMWVDKPQNLGSVIILDESYWQDYQERLENTIAPYEERSGISVRQDESELFVYREAGEIKSVDLKEKPEDYAITKTLSQEELAKTIVDSLQSYLKERKIDASRVILQKNFNEDAENPFLYVDFDQNTAVSLTVEEFEGTKYKGNVVKRGIKTADNLILNSHLLGIVKRPISSAFKLFSWSSSTAYDVIDPKKFSQFKSTPIPPLSNTEPMDLVEFENHLDTLVGQNVGLGTMEFLIGGDDFFPKLIEAILAAKKSIDIRIFIFDNDDYGVEVADVLKKKSRQGVKVRVLLDSMGVVMGEEAIPDSLPEGFIPPYSMNKYLSKKSHIKVRIQPNAWFKADHIKTITIDDQFMFTGGMNIGREYRYEWHDMMVEVHGPVVSKIIDDFELAWQHAGRMGDLAYLKSVMTFKKHQIEGEGYPIRLLYTSANDSQILKAQVAAIKNAKKYIYINNAYFSDNTILRELIAARRRGVDVRVILPINGNHEIMNKSNSVTANIMFENGIRVFFYPGMSHIKASVYDGWLCTGTANFDKLSFRDNLELNLATSHPETANRFVDQLFLTDFKKSREMTEPLKISLKDYLAEFLAEQL